LKIASSQGFKTMTRFRFGESSPEGLSTAIRAAEVIGLVDSNKGELLWSWNKRPARSVVFGVPAHTVLPLEIEVNSSKELGELQSLVEHIKEGA
jgi:hypothetical protein